MNQPSKMITYYILPMLAVLPGCATDTSPPVRLAEEAQWIELFNGEDITGWTAKFAGHKAGVNYRDTFQAKDGILSANYDSYDKFDGEFGHLFFDQTFSHYILKLEYRMIGDQVPGGPSWALRNSGVMLHSQSPHSMSLNQHFPRSVEAQLLNGGATDDRPNGNVCTPGTKFEIDGVLITDHCVNSDSATNRGTDWVSVELEVRGDELIRHRINGVTVMEYSKPQVDGSDTLAPPGNLKDGQPITSGYIALQAESHPVEFRNIRLLDLGR